MLTFIKLLSGRLYYCVAIPPFIKGAGGNGNGVGLPRIKFGAGFRGGMKEMKLDSGSSPE